MRKSLIIVLVLSSVLAFLFAVGGAGIYGSPFAGVPASFPSARRAELNSERLLLALTILVGPFACGSALAVYRRIPKVAGMLLVVGAIAGALLGTTTRFLYIWETVFLISVWLPMLAVAVWTAVPPHRS